jgi:hypothetical protein
MSHFNILPGEYWGSYEFRLYFLKYGHINNEFINSILSIKKYKNLPPLFYWKSLPSSRNTFFYELFKKIALSHSFYDRKFDIEHGNFLEFSQSYLKIPISRIDLLEKIEGTSTLKNPYIASHYYEMNPISYCPICIKEDIERYGVAYFKTFKCLHKNTVFIGCPQCDSSLNNNNFHHRINTKSNMIKSRRFTPIVRIQDSLSNYCRFCGNAPSVNALEYEEYLIDNQKWLEYENK